MVSQLEYDDERPNSDNRHLPSRHSDRAVSDMRPKGEEVEHDELEFQTSRAFARLPTTSRMLRGSDLTIFAPF